VSMLMHQCSGWGLELYVTARCALTHAFALLVAVDCSKQANRNLVIQLKRGRAWLTKQPTAQLENTPPYNDEVATHIVVDAQAVYLEGRCMGLLFSACICWGTLCWVPACTCSECAAIHDPHQWNGANRVVLNEGQVMQSLLLVP